MSEEIEWSQLELAPYRRHYGPVFRPDHMVQSERVPEYDIGIADGAIGVCPSRQAVAALALVGISARRIALLPFIGGYPEMKVCASLTEPVSAQIGRAAANVGMMLQVAAIERR